MKFQLLIFFILFLGLVNCKNNHSFENKDSKNQDINFTIKEQLIEKREVHDTIIFLNKIFPSKYSGDQLTKDLAEEILYQDFVKNGFFRADSIPEIIEGKEEDKFAVYFDTVYLVDLNSSKFIDGVITYWLTPPGASGHCWQPHKAIIRKFQKNRRIIPIPTGTVQ